MVSKLANNLPKNRFDNVFSCKTRIFHLSVCLMYVLVVMHVHKYVHVVIHVHKYVHVVIHVHKYVLVLMHVHKYVLVVIHVHVHNYVLVVIHVHKYFWLKMSFEETMDILIFSQN